MIRRVMSLLIALSAVVAALVVLPAATAQAAACANAWNASAVYTGGQSASYNGRNYTAKWWTQNERPGSSDVWADQGACGGGGGEQPSGFVVSEAQFNQMFPNRNSFYTYSGLTAALSSYPAFANTGSDEVKKREAAAFLANVSHETGGLVHIKEVNEANYPHYCDRNQPYGCPAGQAAYYGRGPIQLSWNFNYKAAGDALGIDLLNNPYLVEQNASVAWRTGLWYWNTQSGPGTMTPHNAIVNNRGFGETIRSINGSIECNGGNPAQVQSRIDKFTSFAQILGTTTGSNLYC
ncbi:glycoside hydrolase family 19 protein [Streptomyces albidoflavus]|uniref:Chitinase n=4 Tax=Streptomyces TaxID=1883 RepID=A0AA37BU38_9ACTN|nr:MULTISPECIES: glycoside hydrolase family 19 protein [Streptomyces]MYQ74255.1 chitinase [Streptomyces sp. SID4934]MYW61663.1 chitinase [Streptomyces sp. SID8370]MYW85462.1 chitinase [Streptomyces sp. SID8371]MYX52769.1 chitinase [Streptomyces sp. SID8385]MYX86190.1 chitinase [Streptomyces sp. SID4915]NUW10098.1 chitinase [Streptomyces sp. CAI-21]NVI29744.1 chitinase [Streptomyces sp. CAI-17]QLA55235.1 chitinase [Streptomyces violascens]SCD74536.1 Predicted chitinase [Streptomyces sp. Igr